MLQQRTLKTLTRAVGVGLHNGQRVELTLRPAQPDTGIVFRRVDLPQPVDIPINAEAVTDTRLASTISVGGAKVHTVEHLMSACAGLGIDNLYVDITAEEVPILDGSSASFVFLCKAQASSCNARPSALSASIARSKCARAKAPMPSGAPHAVPRLQAQFEIDFHHPAVDSTGQRVEFDLGQATTAVTLPVRARLASPVMWR